jgi:hypothetical protein
MAMQFAEWALICGKNVLVIHMEDKVETILMRQTCRWIGATMEELERGDVLHKMDAMKELRQKWQLRTHGTLTYKYLAGNSIPIVIEQIKEVQRQLEMLDKHLDLVVFDYFQKLDIDSQIGKGQNYVNAANAAAEQLKILAEKLGLIMFVVSQETTDMDGGKHTEWTKALEKKPQIYISLTRPIIKKVEDEEIVYVDDNGAQKPFRLSQVGDRSIWCEAKIKKSNQSGGVGKVWLFFDGPRFRMMEPGFYTEVRGGQRSEFDVPVLQPATENFLSNQKRYLEAYNKGILTTKDPDTKKREALREQSW